MNPAPWDPTAPSAPSDLQAPQASVDEMAHPVRLAYPEMTDRTDNQERQARLAALDPQAFQDPAEQRATLDSPESVALWDCPVRTDNPEVPVCQESRALQVCPDRTASLGLRVRPDPPASLDRQDSPDHREPQVSPETLVCQEEREKRELTDFRDRLANPACEDPLVRWASEV